MDRVALLGPTSLDWVVSVFGLSRAGYTVLTLSPRLSAPAIVKLMQETHCECLIYQESPQLLAVVKEAMSLMSLQTLPILSRHLYDVEGPRFERDINIVEERKRTAIIVHSSGSTGLPKPIEIVHARFTTEYPIGPGDRDFLTLPLCVPFPSISRIDSTIVSQIPQLCLSGLSRQDVSAENSLLSKPKFTPNKRKFNDGPTRSETRHSMRRSVRP